MKRMGMILKDTLGRKRKERKGEGKGPCLISLRNKRCYSLMDQWNWSKIIKMSNSPKRLYGENLQGLSRLVRRDDRRKKWSVVISPTSLWYEK